MSPLKTNEPRIQIIEIIKSSDPRYNSPEANEAFAKELAGLIDQGVFKVVIEEELPDDPNVLVARFILCIKDINTGNEKFKARFIVQGHTDSEKEVLLHPSPTISQRSIRLLVALAAIHGFRLWTQDVTQAYLQSALKLSRDIYLKAPKEFGLASNELLKLLKPLYGLSDSGDYWHETFKLHLRKDLLMKQTDGDLALWFKGVGKALQGLIGVYVDDQLGCGTKEFVKYSEETEKKFKSRARCFDKLHFAGIEIDTLQDGSILMHQEPHAKKLKNLEENCTFDDFRSRRHELAWLTHTRPDVAAVANMMSQVTINCFQKKHVRTINSCISEVNQTPQRGLLQHKLDSDSLCMVCYTYSSFANNEDNSTQLGYCIILTDKTGRANWLHYSSYKSKRVVRSVLGGETHAFADGFDTSYLMCHDLSTVMGKKMELTMVTDSMSLFKVIVNASTTTEKRLMIDIRAAREAYEKHEIEHLGWVKSERNIADGLTKLGRCNALEELLNTGRIDTSADKWVERTKLSFAQHSDSEQKENPGDISPPKHRAIEV